MIDMKELERLKIFTAKEKMLLQRCRDVIHLEPGAKVILYGSRVRGNSDPESDYDLLILTDKDFNFKREDLFRRQLFPIELETGIVLTINVYSRHKWDSPLYRAMPFHQNIERDGVIL